MNRKDKNYKEWLRLKEIESKIPWTYGKTKEEGEIKKLLDDPRFWKFHWMSDGPTKDIIKIILGFFIILTVLNKGLKLKFTVTNKERYYIPIGIISGLLNGIAGLGGLPVLLLLSNSNMKKDEFRTTLVSYFLVMNIVAVIGFIINGLYNSLVFSYIGLVVVVSLAVCMFGVYLSRRVDDKWFQRVMLLILFALGAYTMYTGIAGLV